MKRILPLALGVIVLIFAGLLIGPSFVDWNKYKPQIIEQAKSAAGYDVKIDGEIGLSLLPMPQLKIEGLSVAAPRGGTENLLTMKQANVSISIMPLISGDIVIDTVRLVSPYIKLEVLPDGSNSWMSDKLQADRQAPSGGVAPANAAPVKTQNIALNKLIIEDGQVSYNDRQKGATYKAESINADVKADTLQGPFDVSGSVLYNGKKIAFEGSTKGSIGGKGEIPAEIKISLPDSKASASFNGVVALEPVEVQGKMELNADNLGDALAFGGGKPNPALASKLAFSGLVTANEDQVKSEDIDITFGATKGKGSIAVTNLKEQNPVQVAADLTFQGILNFDNLVPAANKNDQSSVEERVAKGEKLSANTGLLPDSITLPFPIDGALHLSADGIQTGGKTFKGVVAQITKSGPLVDAVAKAMDIPGKTTADAKASVRFASSSKSGENGITYIDPSVTFTAVGSSEQLPTLLRAFAPDQDGNAALEIFKTAKFDLSGQVTNDAISLADSTVKLDQTTIGLNASYKPNGVGGKPDVMLDIATDTVDIDYIQSRLNGQKTIAVQKDPAAKTDVKKALEPVRSFEIPANLTFDLSAQKALYNKQQITGIRIKGTAAGQALNLEVASAQDYLGAAASLKGAVNNLKDLSGIDMQFYGKTSDLKSLLQSFQMDTAKLPQSLSSAEANVAAKGTADALAFQANIKALDGQLDAAGKLTGLLDAPSFTNLTIGAKHPNLVKAIQIMNPAFSGGPGLEKPFDFYANAVKTGNSYDLSGMKANLGSTSLNGNLKIDLAGKVPSVTGDLSAGNIPLDSLLGAKTTAANSSSDAAYGSAPAGDAGGGKWSRTTLETGWMQTMNFDLKLAAQSITYGGWNFVKPNTQITLKDGSLLVDKLTAGLFGGNASLSAKIQDPADPKQPLTLALQSQMTKVDLQPLVAALSGSSRLQSSGDVSLDMNVQSSGLSPYALVGGLQGKATLDGNNIVLKGFDLSQIGLAFVDSGKPMDRINNIVGGATQSGETRFDTIKGLYDIMQGIVNITSMAMDGTAASIVSKGNVNLPLWTIDTTHTITFKQAKDAGAFDVAIKGSLSNPANTFGKGLFNDILAKRLQQKAIEKLPDVLGKGLTGKLQGLGILPAQQTPTATDPSATTTDPNAAAPAQTTPVQNEDSSKKALQGVLNGLLH